MSVKCQFCARKSQLFLCGQCTSDLKDMLIGMAQGQKLPSGHRAAGWIEYLEDAALGRTRLGESARRSTEQNSPMPCNLGASQLLQNVHNMLVGWVRHLCESRGIIAPALATTGTVAYWLVQYVDAIACDEAAGEIVNDVQNAVDAIERMINRPIPPRICGPCPVLVTDNSGTHVCNTQLTAKRDEVEIQCPSCKSTHNVEKLIQRTLDALDGLLYSAREVQAMMAAIGQPIPARTWRYWRAEQKLIIRGERDGEPMYWIDDVKNLMARKPQKSATGAAARRTA